MVFGGGDAPNDAVDHFGGRSPHRVGVEREVSLHRSRRTVCSRSGAEKSGRICRHCPVIAECAAEALDNRMEFGVWGGMTERQRRALLKQHPEVDSWAEFFAAQREHRNASQTA